MSNEMAERVQEVLDRVDFSQYTDVLVIGVSENGALDLQPSIAQFPWIHWIMNKTIAEAWMMERREAVMRNAATEEAQVTTLEE